MTTVTYWVPCRVSADVTLSEAGAARVEELVRNVLDNGGATSDSEARHLVLADIVRFIGPFGRASNTDGFADLDDSDIQVGADDWSPAWVSEVEVQP